MIICHGSEELKVLVSLESVRLVDCRSLSSNGGELDLIVTGLLSPEHNLEALVKKLLGLLKGHVLSPVGLEKNLAEIIGKASGNPIALLLEAVRVRPSEEL